MVAIERDMVVIGRDMVVIGRDIVVIGRDMVVRHWEGSEMYTGSSLGGWDGENEHRSAYMVWRVCDSLNPHVYYRVLAVTHMVRFFDYPFFRILFQLEN